MSQLIKYDSDSIFELGSVFNGFAFCSRCDNPFDYFLVDQGNITLVCEDCKPFQNTTIRVVQGNPANQIVITGNQFCGLCQAELGINNAIEVISHVANKTVVTYANTCIGCTKTALAASVGSSVRRSILEQMSNEIALNFYFEIGDSFCTSTEYLETQWFNEFIGEEIMRSLGLQDNLLPLEHNGKAGRKAYRKAKFADIYKQIQVEIENDFILRYTKITQKINNQLQVLTKMINYYRFEFGLTVNSQEQKTRINKRGFLANRLQTRNVMGI